METIENVSVSSLARKLKCNHNSVGDVLMNRQMTAGRRFQIFTFRDGRYPEKIGDVSNVVNENNGLPVVKFFSGRMITMYKSAADAAYKNGVDISHVIKCCKGNLRRVGPYVFRYANQITLNPVADSSTSAP